MKIKPKNWDAHQHYKTRNPPWIKLHKRLLDDFDFQGLPLASRALAPMLWLIASESKDGSFDADAGLIAFRLRANPKEVQQALIPLIERGFFTCLQDASNALAPQLHDATSEKTETETETTLSAKARTVDIPQGFLDFWAAWPKSQRKVAKPQCLKVWQKGGLEAIADQIVAHVATCRESDQWQRGYDPAPLTYLNQRRWDAESEPQYRGNVL